MSNLFKIVKIGGLYRVVTVSSETVIFSSARRINCKEFIAENFPEPKPQQSDK